MKILKNSFAGASLLALAGCVSGGNYQGGELIGPVGGNVVLSEGPDYSTSRTRMTNQPVDCTVTTYEEGKVYGGRTVYETGSAARTCVSGSNGRYRGSQLEEMSDRVDQATDLIYSVRSLQHALDF